MHGLLHGLCVVYACPRHGQGEGEHLQAQQRCAGPHAHGCARRRGRRPRPARRVWLQQYLDRHLAEVVDLGRESRQLVAAHVLVGVGVGVGVGVRVGVRARVRARARLGLGLELESGLGLGLGTRVRPNLEGVQVDGVVVSEVEEYVECLLRRLAPLLVAEYQVHPLV